MLSIQAIIGKIWSSTTIFDPVDYLSDEIGPRPTGSDNSNQAMKFLVEQFEKIGLATTSQKFNTKVWIAKATSVSDNNKTFNAVSFGFSGIGEVTGKILPLINPNPKMLEKIDFNDKIVVYLNSMGAMGAMGGRGISRDDLIKKAQEGKAKGFIEISNKLAGIIEKRNLKEPAVIPTVIVSQEDGHYLLRNKKDVTIQVDGESKEVSSVNIKTVSEKESNKKFLLVAHYDTAVDSPGAFDNATGIATLLEMAKVFTEFNKTPFEVEYTALDASKWNFNGAVNYVKENITEDNKPLLTMNFDTTAKPNGTRNGVLANDMRFFGMTKRFLDKHGFEIEFTPMPIFGTDATIFYQQKLPIFVINQWKIPTFINTPYDTSEKLSINSLKNSTSISAAVLSNLINMASRMSGGHPAGHPGQK